MARSTRPGRGPVAHVPDSPATERIAQRNRARPGRGPRQHSGEWRPDRGFEQVEGLKVTMRRARGITGPNILKVPLRFQVPPLGDFAREYGYEWSKFSTLRRGERARPMGEVLETIELETMLLDGPAQDDAGFAITWRHAPAPQRIIRELKWIMGKAPRSRPQPFRLTINQPGVWPGEWLVNGVFYISRVRATQKHGEVGTEYLSLTLEEFDDLDVHRNRRPRGDETTRYHDLKKKDDLYELAKRYYRASSKWRLIRDANGIKGVSPGSEAELWKWAEKHKKKRLRIPPLPQAGRIVTPRAGGIFGAGGGGLITGRPGRGSIEEA